MFGKQYYKTGRLSKKAPVADHHPDPVFKDLKLTMRLVL